MKQDKEIDIRMNRHQVYVARQWQYFAAFLLLQGLLLNSAKELIEESVGVFLGLALASLITTVVFHHLILWAKVRIHRNVFEINKLVGKDFIELPTSSKLEGVTMWLSLSMLSFTLCWLALIYNVSGLIAAACVVAVVLLLAILSLSSAKSLLNRAAPKE